MGLPIERWARQATILDPPPRRLLEDIDDLKTFERLNWRKIDREIKKSGVPENLEGIYAGLAAFPPAGVLPTVTSISGETLLWPAVPWTALPANSILVPEAYRIAVTGNITTGATPGNITLTPRIGTTTGGATLGASSAFALTASITNAFFYIIGDLTFRTSGAPGGNNYTAFGLFHWVSTQATASGLAGPAVVGAGHNVLFGHTSAAFDGSVASGLVMGVTHTTTVVTYAVQQIHWMSWNVSEVDEDCDNAGDRFHEYNPFGDPFLVGE